jgi:uncharacterized protein
MNWSRTKAWSCARDANLLIYLNTTTEEVREGYDDFYTELVENNHLYVEILILDELLYIYKKKYNVPYSVTTKFIEDIARARESAPPL